MSGRIFPLGLILCVAAAANRRVFADAEADGGLCPVQGSQKALARGPRFGRRRNCGRKADGRSLRSPHVVAQVTALLDANARDWKEVPFSKPCLRFTLSATTQTETAEWVSFEPGYDATSAVYIQKNGFYTHISMETFQRLLRDFRRPRLARKPACRPSGPRRPRCDCPTAASAAINAKLYLLRKAMLVGSSPFAPRKQRSFLATFAERKATKDFPKQKLNCPMPRWRTRTAGALLFAALAAAAGNLLLAHRGEAQAWHEGFETGQPSCARPAAMPSTASCGGSGPKATLTREKPANGGKSRPTAGPMSTSPTTSAAPA